METIKESKNVEFDVIYDDGSRHRVKDGVLFDADGECVVFHNGTKRPEVIFATFRATREIIRNMVNGPKEVADRLIVQLLMEE